MVSVDVKHHVIVQELCESRGGRPGLLVPNRRVSVDVKQHWTRIHRDKELCESLGGRPGLSVLTSLLVSVDVKIY